MYNFLKKITGKEGKKRSEKTRNFKFFSIDFLRIFACFWQKL